MAPLPASRSAISLDERLSAARQWLEAGQVEKAETQLLPALQHPASRAEALYLLAVAAVIGGRAAAAEIHARAAIAERPGDSRFHFALGRAHKLGGQLPAAIAAYRQAIALDGRYAEAHVSLGIALKHGGQLEAAIQCYEQAIALNPGLGVAQLNVAYARAALAERDAEAGADEAPAYEAIAHTERAAASDPGNASLQLNLGLLLRRARRRSDAITAFNRALGISPGDVTYCLQLGHELTASGALKSAIVLYERWQGVNPANPTVMRLLGGLLAREGSVSAALDWSERAAALEPDPKAYLQLCHTYLQCRRLGDALAAGCRAIELSGGDWQAYQIPLMVANYLLEDPQAVAAFHADFGDALAVSLPLDRQRPAWRAKAPGERLRVGYVSADFLNHSVAFFMGPLLEHHDRSRFEVWCYYNRGWGDGMTDDLKALGHHWVECEHLSDNALLRRVADDGIDILVDLIGHTAGSRTRVFGLGAAPLQVSYLGYPTVSGVRRIDRRVTDRIIDPGDIADTACESPLHLPRSMFCYRAPEQPVIEAPPLLRNGFVTFGSFNNHAKLADHCLELWAQILLAVPGSRLLLKSASVADPANRRELESFMARHGVLADRLDLRWRVEDRRGHFEAYNEVDVALDPFPYNGATTTCEALWMGVPVVSKYGRTHTSRMGASILSAAGKAEWVAVSDAGYAAVATSLACDPALLARWRSEARDWLARSELLDERGFCRRFETLLKHAWAAAAPGQEQGQD